MVGAVKCRLAGKNIQHSVNPRLNVSLFQLVIIVLVDLIIFSPYSISMTEKHDLLGYVCKNFFFLFRSLRFSMFVLFHVVRSFQQWLCRMLKSLDNYMVDANFAWMFVEGLFLHNRLAVSVFSSEAPFVLFYLIGWGKTLLFFKNSH